MAIALVSGGYNGATSPTNTLTFNLSSVTSWTAGNFALMLACGYSTTPDSAAIVPPAGWTTIHQAEGMWLGYRFLQAGDTSWTVTCTNGSDIGVEFTQLTGVDTSNPVDVTAFAHLRGQGPQGYAGGTCPPVNPNYANDFLVHVAGCNSSGSSSTPPSGWSGLGSVNGNGIGLRLSGLQASSAGTTAQVSAGTLVMSGPFAFSGMVALKTAGDTLVSPQPPFPYLAGTIYSFSAQATTSSPITASFHDLFSPGDLLLVHITISTATTVTPPAGWTQLTLNSNSLLFYRTAQSGDPSALSFSVAASTYAICHTQTIKPHGSSNSPLVDSSGFNSAAASTTTPSTPALTASVATDLLLTRIDNTGTSSSTIAYHPSGANFEDIISYYGPNSSLGHLCNSPSPTPTAYGTKSTAGVGLDTAIAMNIKLYVPPPAPPPRQMFLT